MVPNPVSLVVQIVINNDDHDGHDASTSDCRLSFWFWCAGRLALPENTVTGSTHPTTEGADRGHRRDSHLRQDGGEPKKRISTHAITLKTCTPQLSFSVPFR